MTQTASLGGAAARGAAKTMLGQIARLAIHLTGIVVLARMLDPADYGLLAMVLAVIGVGEIFRDFGLSSAAIQSKTLSRHERDNLFWINTTIGSGLTVVVLGMSFVLPLIFNEPRLQPVAAALSVTFLMNGLSTQYRADLNRNLRFGSLAIVEIIAPLLGLAVGILAAASGWAYWSLVAQQLAIPFVSLILVVWFTKWVPGLPHRNTSVRPFVKFGANLLGVQLLTYASRNADSIVIGARFGTTSLGLYDRAFQLLVVPLNQINAPATRVALPVLSRLQDDSVKFGAFLLRGQTVLIYAVTAFFIYAAVHAPSVIAVVLGPHWGESAPLFQALAVGGIAQGLSYATYWVFLAFGLTASNLRYALATRPFLICAVLIGAIWGPFGVALSYSVTLLAFWPFGLWWISRISPAPVRQMLFGGLRALGGLIACGAASLLSVQWVGEEPLLQLVVGLGAFLLAMGLVALVWPAFRGDLYSIAELRTALGRTK